MPNHLKKKRIAVFVLVQNLIMMMFITQLLSSNKILVYCYDIMKITISANLQLASMLMLL